MARESEPVEVAPRERNGTSAAAAFDAVQAHLRPPDRSRWSMLSSLRTRQASGRDARALPLGARVRAMVGAAEAVQRRVQGVPGHGSGSGCARPRLRRGLGLGLDGWRRLGLGFGSRGLGLGRGPAPAPAARGACTEQAEQPREPARRARCARARARLALAPASRLRLRAPAPAGVDAARARATRHGGRGLGGGSTTAGSEAGASSLAVRNTLVPHPAGSSRTVPRAALPSQATAVSGSSLVMRISPNWPR